MKAPAEALEKRVATLIDERRVLQQQLDEAIKGGGTRCSVSWRNGDCPAAVSFAAR